MHKLFIHSEHNYEIKFAKKTKENEKIANFALWLMQTDYLNHPTLSIPITGNWARSLDL